MYVNLKESSFFKIQEKMLKLFKFENFAFKIARF